MAQAKGKAQSTSDGATMQSLSNWSGEGGDTDVRPDFVDDAPPQPSQDIVETVDATIVAAAGRAADLIRSRGYGPSTITIVQYIAAHAADTNELNAVIIEQMAARMLQAESIEQVLDPFGTMAGREMYGRPLWVTGVTFIESDYSEGFPYYVSFAIQDQNSGSTSVVTVGGEKVCMQAAAIDMHDAWPQMLAIHQADKETKAGFRPLELRAVKS